MPMVAVMGGIFYLSSQTGDSLTLPPIPEIDKFAHLLAYGTLAATVFFASSEEFRRSRPVLAAVIVIVFCTIYGISDEYHQSFVPERSVEALDVLADCAGATSVAAIWYFWWRRNFFVTRS